MSKELNAFSLGYFRIQFSNISLARLGGKCDGTKLAQLEDARFIDFFVSVKRSKSDDRVDMVTKFVTHTNNISKIRLRKLDESEHSVGRTSTFQIPSSLLEDWYDDMVAVTKAIDIQ